MNKLTRIQAWKEIRADFNTLATTGRTSSASTGGLCHAVDVAYFGDRISPLVCSRMHRDICSVKPKNCVMPWYWPTTRFQPFQAREGAASRVKAINKILRRKTK